VMLSDWTDEDRGYWPSSRNSRTTTTTTSAPLATSSTT
jgi:hypothetical protein